jgi:zinc-binding alcohol dehydrogenase family protein
MISKEIQVKAIGYTQIGGPEVLTDITIEKPGAGPRDLVVQVKAISVNPVDTKVRKGAAPQDGQAKVIGYDAAGIVVEVGSEVSLFKVGDEVFYCGTINRQGTNSEFHAVDERIVGRKPTSLSFAEAAALPLTALTAWELLFDRLRVPYGAKTLGGAILVINGAGGVGSILIQLARRLTGLTVIASTSRPETKDWVSKMGSHHVVNHRKALDVEVRALGINHVEYVAGLTDTDKHLSEIVEIIAPQGSLSLIDDGSLDIGKLKPKSVTVSWEMVFTRPLFETPDMIRQHQILNEVSALLDAGVLKTTMTTDFGPINADNLKKAHEHLETGKTIGKVVLNGFA